MNFLLRNNLSLLAGLFAIVLEYYFIDNVKDQYYSILFTLVLIPVVFHTFSFERIHLFDNGKYFSILLLSSKFLIPLLYIVIFISMYDFSVFYKYSPANQVALRSPILYWLPLLILISIFCLYLVKISCLPIKRHVFIRKYIDFISVFLATLFCCFLAYHLLIHELHRYNENFLNLGIVFNPIVQVFNGATVLIDTKSQYGLYPHFFEPILHLTGISITSISAIMAVLFIITIGSWFFFLVKTTRNSFLSLIGLIVASFASLSYGTSWPGELYYQYFPLRTFFPAIFLLIFSFYYDYRNWYSRIIISSLLSLGIIWNFESGVSTFLCFVCLDVYLQYDINKKYIFNFYAIVKNTFISLLALVVVFLIFFTYMKIRSGSLPTVQDFFHYHTLYATVVIHGYGIPLHPQMLVMILFYLLGISYGIGSLFSGYRDKLNSGIFIISILGMGTSVYYFLKGYHITHESYALYPIIILITLFSGRLLINLRPINFLNRQWLKNNHLSLFYLFLSVSFLFFVSSVFAIGYKYDTNFTTTARYHEIIYPSATNNKSLGIIKLDNYDSNQYDFDFIKISDLAKDNPEQRLPKWINKYNVLKKYRGKNGNIREDILILSNYDYFLYLKLNAKAPVKIANVNHIWDEDFYHIYDTIKNNKNIRYVVVDNENILHPYSHVINGLIGEVKNNFSLIESFDIGYAWFTYPNKIIGRSENPARCCFNWADNQNLHKLVEVKKIEPSWNKNIIQVFKRSD